MPAKKKSKKNRSRKVGLSPGVASLGAALTTLDADTRDDQDRDVYNICWNDDWIEDQVTFAQFKGGRNELFLFHKRTYPVEEARQLDIALFATDLDAKLVFLGYTRRTGNPAIARGAIAASVQDKSVTIKAGLLDTVEQQFVPPQSPL